MLKELENASALKFLCYALLGFIFQKALVLSTILPILIGILLFLSLLLLITNYKFVSIFLILFSFGLFTAERTRNLDFSYNGNFPPQINGLFNGKVLESLKEKDKTSRFIIQGDIITEGFHEIQNAKLHFTLINSKTENIKLKEGYEIFAKINFRLPNQSTLPGEFSEKSYYRSIGVNYTAYSFSKDIAIMDNTESVNLQKKISNSISNKIDIMFSNTTSSIVKAIILGDQSKIPMEIRQNFSLSGTAHILSVSGLHVGIIAVIIFWVFSFIKNNLLKFIIFSITLWSYSILVDLQPAVVRASFMIMLFTFAKVVQRKPNNLNIIAITVLIVSLINPDTLYNAGFQMSVASIFGISLLYNPISNFFQKFLKLNNNKYFQKIVLSSLSMSFSASIIVSPIVAYYFNIYSIISPLTNLVTIPIMVFAQIYSIFAIILSYIYLPIGQIFAVTAQICIEISEKLTELSVKLPGAYISGKEVLFLSILISVSLIVIFISKNSKQLVFRILNTIVINSFVIYFFLIQAKEDFQISKRPTCDYIEIIDRKISLIKETNSQNDKRYDYGLSTYLNKIDINLKVFYSGLTGELLLDKVKNPNVRFIKIEDNQMKLLFRKAYLNRN